MNKYQSYIIGEGLSNIKCQSVPMGLDKNVQYVKYIKEDNKLIITQDSDITITDYVLSINNIEIDAIEKIMVLKADKWQEIDKNNTIYIELNFLNKTSQIKFVFKNNIADDYILGVEFIEADKEAYYDKKEKEQKAALLKKANIKVSTGANLVNIYFQPCCDSYVRAEIELYKDGMMLAKYKVDEETFFKSIGGLAFGKYEFVLKQLDKDNNLVLETQYIEFQIKPPSTPIVGRINRI